MKILVTADWHFHPFKAFSHIGEDGLNSRLADIAAAWRLCLEKGSEAGCEVMCVAGDLFHVRGQLKPSVVNVVLGCISDAVDRHGMRLVMIPGNHDMEDFRGGPTAVDLFGGMMGVHVLHDMVVEINGVKFMGIPYRQDVNEFLRVARELCEKHELEPGRAVVLCHQGLDDVCAGTGMPPTGLSAAAVEDVFGRGMPVFLGHYHSHWRLNWRLSGVIQVGAPIQHSFSSEGRATGWWIYDTERGPMYIENHNSPKFVTLTEKSRGGEWNHGDFIRVVMPDLRKAEKLAERLMKNGAGGVTAQVVKDLSEYTAARGDIDIGTEPTSVRSMVERYLSGQPDMKPHTEQVLALYDEVCG